MVDLKTLKKAAKEINMLKIKGLKPLKVVAVKKVDLAAKFLDAIDYIADNKEEDKLSDFVVQVNNDLLDEIEEAGAEPVEEPEVPEKEEGKEEPVEEEKTEEEPVEEKPEKKSSTKKSSTKKSSTKKSTKKTTKKKKSSVSHKNRSCYGHIAGRMSGMIDEMLREGNTIEDIMEGVGATRVRIMNHIKHLRDDCGLTVIHKPDKKDDKLKDFYQIKEQEYRKPTK